MNSTKLEIFKESMKFSAAHFTVFSASERERLHGHNFQVYCSFEMMVGDEGLNINYRVLKEIINNLCKEWDEYVLLPLKSKYLEFLEKEDYIYAKFNDEMIPFLRKDVLFLDAFNITVEELSKLFAEKLKLKINVEEISIDKVEVKISSGKGQWGSFQLEV